MNVVDSSAWLEYFANGANADFFAKPIEQIEKLIVPSLTVYEVYKKVLIERDHDQAIRAIGAMLQGTVVDLDASIALSAAEISVENRLPMADSIILATARLHGATVWTQDSDFQGLPDVQYRKKKRR